MEEFSPFDVGGFIAEDEALSSSFIGETRMVQQHEEIDRHHALQLQQVYQQSADVAAAALVNNIASFLTFSDAASLVSLVPSSSARLLFQDDESDVTPADSWAVGVEFDGSTWSMDTPPTPAIIAISPGATPNVTDELQNDDIEHVHTSNIDSRKKDCVNDIYLGDVLRERRRRWAQEKITAAVFAHPKPLRAYCVEAFDAAMRIRQQKEHSSLPKETSPETLHEPCNPIARKRKRTKQERGLQMLHQTIDVFFQGVPLSVTLDLLESLGCFSLDTTLASLQLTSMTMNTIISALGSALQSIWKTIASFNPLQLLEAIISLQFNAMGKTSEVLASGIQSVATGVGSASSMALYRLSTANLSASRLESSSSLAGNASSVGRRPSSSDFFRKKLLRKLSAINDAGRVVSYREIEDDTGGLTRQAVSRTRRMMHYTVPLRPFVATVAISPYHESYPDGGDKCKLKTENSCGDFSKESSSSTLYNEEDDTPFMCTPQSFPPTPHSRQMVIAQRSQFSDDVVFIARDRLRIHDGLKSDDERTRERSRVLEHEKRLAVFTCKDPTSGIELTCGRHIATKVGHMYYASTRSMIPILRNCFVYFELTILPQHGTDSGLPASLATLSIGLSTEEMPPNTLVGAWQGSVGLCTSGQILMAGQWCSPADPVMSAYGADATVGCLVYLDDESAFETWDGVMVKAVIRFNVNGIMVSQPVSTLPMSGSPVSQPPLSGASTPSVNSYREQPGTMAATLGSTQSATLALLVPAIEDLYPTVTIQSSGTAVVCRFSTEDIAATSRLVIGAPEGTCVYAVDGSVILNFDD